MKVLKDGGARIGLKINGKKIKALKLGTNEGEKMVLRSERINIVDSFICLSY